MEGNDQDTIKFQILPQKPKGKGLETNEKPKETAISQQMATKRTRSRRQTESRRTMSIRINYKRSVALERSAINYWVWGMLKPAVRSTLLYESTKLFGPREGYLTDLCIKNRDSTMRWNKMSSQKQDQHWGLKSLLKEGLRNLNFMVTLYRFKTKILNGMNFSYQLRKITISL